MNELDNSSIYFVKYECLHLLKCLIFRHSDKSAASSEHEDKTGEKVSGDIACDWLISNQNMP